MRSRGQRKARPHLAKFNAHRASHQHDFDLTKAEAIRKAADDVKDPDVFGSMFVPCPPQSHPLLRKHPRRPLQRRSTWIGGHFQRYLCFFVFVILFFFRASVSTSVDLLIRISMTLLRNHFHRDVDRLAVIPPRTARSTPLFSGDWF